MAIFIDNSLEIGTGAADPTSAIDIVSTTQGFLPPRMTTIERDAIPSPATGLEIYNIDNSRPEFFNGLIWTFPAGAPSGNPGGSNTQVQFNDNSVFGGSPDFVFDGNNVGIGNVSPDAKLDIIDDGSTGDWAIQVSSGDNLWRSVAFGNGIFVAVSDTPGTANQVMTSPDGVTWTARTSALDVLWQDITFGAGLFVAIFTTFTPTGANQVMTSPDGITWTLRSCPAANWATITFGGGLFVALPSGGPNIAMISPDGINWTSQVTPVFGRSWRDVAFGNNTYVAISPVGTGGDRGMTSPDGITWTLRPIPALSWQSITFGNGLFVAVSISGTGDRVMTSPDGITWTQQTTPADNNWLSITFGNGVFMAVAETGTGNRAMSSTDGINWIIETTPADNEWNGIGFGDNKFVSVSVTGTGDRAMLFAIVIAQTSILRLDSTTSGFLPPRLTTIERDAINLPPTGLEIYNITSNQPEYFDGTIWKATVIGPAGLNTEIQFNDNGVFGAESDFVWTGSTLGIGPLTPDPSSQIDLNGAARGFLPPRLVVFVRDTIPSPAIGLQIHNTTSNQPEFFDGTNWQAMTGGPAVNPGGANTQIQFNDSGAFNGSTDFVFTGSAVGIGTSVPDPSAALEINSTVSGLLLPRLTTIQRDAIVSPATGLEIYNTTTNEPQFFNGSVWKASGIVTNPGGANTQIQFNDNGVFEGSFDFVFNGQSVGIGTSTPVASAVLEINSTIQGFLMPVMATAQRDAIVLPANGLEIYNTTTSQPEFFNGTIWTTTAGAATTPGGVNTQIQFNDSGAFNGSADLVFTGSAVGIGTATPDTSAALEINSTVSGLLPPRLTTVQRNAIVLPATGLEIYNTTSNQPEYFDGTIWKATTGTVTNPGGASTEIQFNNSGVFDGDSNFVFTGSAVGIGTNSPDPSTALEINSTVSGFLKPVMTTAQRDLIPSPVDGLEIYNSTTNQPEYFDGIVWKAVSAPATNPAGANTQIQFNDAGTFGAAADFVFNGASVGIGTNIPVANAILELNSTIQGFLKPVMTTVQRDAIVLPATGLEIYNATTSQPEFFDGAIWKATSGVTNPGGANTQIQFNDSGAFGADADFVFNGLSVGIGTSAPVANAALEINSTTQGFLPSRMTTTQRNAIPSPETGLMLYNTTQNRVNVFNGSSWKQIAWLSDVDD